MIHFIPESPARELPAPYAEAVARLASIRRALACVEQVAGKDISHRDSEARLALGFPGASPPLQSCFDARSARVAGAAAAGLEAIALLQDSGHPPHPAALAALECELDNGMTEIDLLFSL
ncbi:MAG: hypothetical protein M3Q88_03495 [Pseudomonadota bacterium]|nr:hypothetical protein [Pseudomonadota bacterium]